MATARSAESYPAAAKATAGVVVPAMFIAGVFLLSLSAIVFSLGNTVITNPTPEQINNNRNLQDVYSPILRNLGMFFILAAIFGAPAVFDRVDPIARILMLVIALIAVLLLLTSPSALFG